MEGLVYGLYGLKVFAKELGFGGDKTCLLTLL